MELLIWVWGSLNIMGPPHSSSPASNTTLSPRYIAAVLCIIHHVPHRLGLTAFTFRAWFLIYRQGKEGGSIWAQEWQTAQGWDSVRRLWQLTLGIPLLWNCSSWLSDRLLDTFGRKYPSWPKYLWKKWSKIYVCAFYGQADPKTLPIVTDTLGTLVSKHPGMS